MKKGLESGIEDWHKWFAWYPVRIFDDGYVIGKTVERRWSDDYHGWIYRRIYLKHS